MWSPRSDPPVAEHEQPPELLAEPPGFAGISFVPHGSPGHSGSCAWAGGQLGADTDEEDRAIEEEGGA